jgi:hypothetical protein
MEYRKIAEIKPNPRNPRTIRDDRFAKLVQSIKDFPEMLEKRPLICYTDLVDGKLVILGGNMRYKAAKEAGLKKLPVILADDWTEEQKQQFLIKDNVGFGEWNWSELQTDFDVEQLEDWGLEVPGFDKGLEINSMTEDELNDNEEFDPIGKASGFQRVVLIFDGPEDAESYLNAKGLTYKKQNMAWQVDLTTNSRFTSFLKAEPTDL